jgi:hypothetical protein
MKVTIENHNGRLRLRWKYQNRRCSVAVGMADTPTGRAVAKQKAAHLNRTVFTITFKTRNTIGMVHFIKSGKALELTSATAKLSTLVPCRRLKTHLFFQFGREFIGEDCFLVINCSLPISSMIV